MGADIEVIHARKNTRWEYALLTLMTATIVVGIWLLARPALEQLFDRAMTIIPGI